MNRKTKDPMDQQLLLIEKLRQQLVSEILEKTDLSLDDFTVDIDINISFADGANNDFYEAAKELRWKHDKNDGVIWHTSAPLENGETVVYGVSE